MNSPDTAEVPNQFAAIAIGVSAGAVEALGEVLPNLPADFPLPVFIVVHLPPDRCSVIADLFRAKCRLEVREAEDKEPFVPGTIYFAPPDYHLLIEKNGTLSLSNEEQVNYSRPSIDVLFESAADAFGRNLLGIVLTGASHDGAAGLRAIEDAGGVVVVQSPDSAQASTMPRAAIALCRHATVLELKEISTYLREQILTR